MTAPEPAPAASPRSGRRRGKPDTRAEILRVAREHFARGYGHVSVRGIARDAGVDPALAARFFGTKEELFLAAIRDVMRPGDGLEAALAGPDEGLGQRLAAYFIGLWEDPSTRLPLQAIVVSAAAHPPANELYRAFVTEELVGRLAAHAGPDDPEARAALAGSQLIGFAFARYLVGVPALVRMPPDVAASALGRTIDSYVSGPSPL